MNFHEHFKDFSTSDLKPSMRNMVEIDNQVRLDKQAEQAKIYNIKENSDETSSRSKT